jgi:site-specific recombinase XerD
MTLPSTARAFLRTSVSPETKRAVFHFHRWLQRRQLALSDLQPSHIGTFLDRPIRKRLATLTRRRYRFGVLTYLDRLYHKGQIFFDPSKLPGFPNSRPMPSIATAFVETLKPTQKLSTWTHYKRALRSFHNGLDDSGVCLSALKREHMVSWFRALNDKGLQPSTRLSTIINVRVYLRWLHEQRLIHAHPDDLVRGTDLPKLPSYLPRPFPPDADHELQVRLEKSTCQYQLGLLLMRRTGLRLGELTSLEVNCVRIDLHSNKFLKVPLGKLDNERLVPIDVKTQSVIERLQSMGHENKQWLLERGGKKTPQFYYREALRQACHGLETAGPVVSHRLRHSYATSLLNAGMSLVGVMKLLGHRDYRMTLRYAAITQETVRQEYSDAISSIEKKYGTVRHPKTSEPDPLKMVSDLNRWIHKNVNQDNPVVKRRVRSLSKRLERIKRDIQLIASQKRQR